MYIYNTNHKLGFHNTNRQKWFSTTQTDKLGFYNTNHQIGFLQHKQTNWVSTTQTTKLSFFNTNRQIGFLQHKLTNWVSTTQTTKLSVLLPFAGQLSTGSNPTEWVFSLLCICGCCGMKGFMVAGVQILPPTF